MKKKGEKMEIKDGKITYALLKKNLTKLALYL